MAFLFFTHEICAEDSSSTNVQFLYGSDFDKVAGGDSINDGVLKTITLEHAGTWKYGNNFFFVDMSTGDYASKNTSKVYAEWAPKISLSKLTSKDFSFGIIKDVSLAAELNRGDNFTAYNGGIGLALEILDFNFFDYYGVDDGSEIVSQPRLLIDGEYFSQDLKTLQAGVELYYYRSSANARRKAINEAVPQLMVK